MASIIKRTKVDIDRIKFTNRKITDSRTFVRFLSGSKVVTIYSPTNASLTRLSLLLARQGWSITPVVWEHGMHINYFRPQGENE